MAYCDFGLLLAPLQQVLVAYCIFFGRQIGVHGFCLFKHIPAHPAELLRAELISGSLRSRSVGLGARMMNVETITSEAPGLRGAV